jgi:hypothetical protein
VVVGSSGHKYRPRLDSVVVVVVVVAVQQQQGHSQVI